VEIVHHQEEEGLPSESKNQEIILKAFETLPDENNKKGKSVMLRTV